VLFDYSIFKFLVVNLRGKTTIFFTFSAKYQKMRIKNTILFIEWLAGWLGSAGSAVKNCRRLAAQENDRLSRLARLGAAGSDV